MAGRWDPEYSSSSRLGQQDCIGIGDMQRKEIGVCFTNPMKEKTWPATRV